MTCSSSYELSPFISLSLSRVLLLYLVFYFLSLFLSFSLPLLLSLWPTLAHWRCSCIQLILTNVLLPLLLYVYVCVNASVSLWELKQPRAWQTEAHFNPYIFPPFAFTDAVVVFLIHWTFARTDLVPFFTTVHFTSLHFSVSKWVQESENGNLNIAHSASAGISFCPSSFGSFSISHFHHSIGTLVSLNILFFLLFSSLSFYLSISLSFFLTKRQLITCFLYLANFRPSGA